MFYTVQGVVAYLSWSLLGASRARILFVLLSVNFSFVGVTCSFGDQNIRVHRGVLSIRVRVTLRPGVSGDEG